MTAGKYHESIARALGWLAETQDDSGEIPVFTAMQRDMRGELTRDPSIFPTALAAQALANVPGARDVRARALDFLLQERQPGGLWSHWPRSHRLARMLPPDCDDTSCASQALESAKIAGGAPRALLLSNRARNGLFLTWIVPRPGTLRRGRIALTLRQAARPLGLLALFTRTSARPGDIDAVVNANTLFCLGRYAGDEPVIAYLRHVLEQGAERDCDKWYDNPFVVRYFLARALAAVGELDADLIARRASAARPGNALEQALHISTLQFAGLSVPPPLADALASAQCAEGSWPCAALYHGGRKRLRGGGFAPPHRDTPHWGSAALTTIFAIEALARLDVS